MGGRGAQSFNLERSMCGCVCVFAFRYAYGYGLANAYFPVSRCRSRPPKGKRRGSGQDRPVSAHVSVTGLTGNFFLPLRRPSRVFARVPAIRLCLARTLPWTVHEDTLTHPVSMSPSRSEIDRVTRSKMAGTGAKRT